MGKLQMQKRAYDEAVDTLLRASKLASEDGEVLDLLGDARIRGFEPRIQSAEEEAQTGEDGAEDRLRRLKRELVDLKLDEGRRRVAAHPSDMGLRFRLGASLLDAGEMDEAIEQFQHAVKDPKHNVATLHLLGRAFAGKGILDLAIKQFTAASDKIGAMTDQRKEILYELAQAQERGEDRAHAVATYKRIYEADISYRDVAKRIEALSA